ncbi:DeoR family transcriptional regulator [Lottiidibacillus patelloidae]|uniref:DeoR family transcriptional regulator n=1 Tax=Lottiidibacillus patelloidae TaxID=2670334 RepID=A0A263BY79_9BACI|nr:DeoR/GlpR family DNA-binding transcription regulator [Lottiidibacillus patelloidae]OZM58693.1 DeoR family transcriptional regulator [Lottiidibacillus patelloidae]
MFSEERREEILKLVEKNGRILAKDLAEKFQVSIDSIRRDLSIMEDQGLLKRTHGGAIPLTQAQALPLVPSLRYGEGTEYQQAIAKQAVSYIGEGDTVFLGGASIHYAMLHYLPNNISYTVITNSLEIAYKLRAAEHIETYLIGGKVKGSGNITDALANAFARQFTVDLCFATAGGLSEKGLSTATPEVALFHKTVYSNAKKIVTLAEHTKIGQNMFTVMFPLEKLDVIITDNETTKEDIQMLEAHGAKVIVAD